MMSLLGFACGNSPGVPNGATVRDGGPATGGCGYPGGVEPMTKDQVIWPYRWPARTMSNDATDLELEHAHCNTDDDMDWSPFDVLLFVSIPAW